MRYYAKRRDAAIIITLSPPFHCFFSPLFTISYFHHYIHYSILPSYAILLIISMPFLFSPSHVIHASYSHWYAQYDAPSYLISCHFIFAAIFRHLFFHYYAFLRLFHAAPLLFARLFSLSLHYFITYLFASSFHFLPFALRFYYYCYFSPLLPLITPLFAIIFCPIFIISLFSFVYAIAAFHYSLLFAHFHYFHYFPCFHYFITPSLFIIAIIFSAFFPLLIIIAISLSFLRFNSCLSHCLIFILSDHFEHDTYQFQLLPPYRFLIASSLFSISLLLFAVTLLLCHMLV